MAGVMNHVDELSPLSAEHGSYVQIIMLQYQDLSYVKFMKRINVQP